MYDMKIYWKCKMMSKRVAVNYFNQSKLLSWNFKHILNNKVKRSLLKSNQLKSFSTISLIWFLLTMLVLVNRNFVLYIDWIMLKHESILVAALISGLPELSALHFVKNWFELYWIRSLWRFHSIHLVHYNYYWI